jgi:hypothetical protein
MDKRIIIRIKRSAATAAMRLLLVLYVIGSFGIERFHSITHHTEQDARHSGEEETNPCHRAVYHQDGENGCDHRTHLSAGDACDICGLAGQIDQIIFVDFVCSSCNSTLQVDLYGLRPDSYNAVISSSRAPPSIV